MKKSFFKRSLYFILTLALILSSPFSIHAHPLESLIPTFIPFPLEEPSFQFPNCDCNVDYDIIDGRDTNEYVLITGQEDVCFYYSFIVTVICPDCNFMHDNIFALVDFEHSIVGELENLGEGRYRETLYCEDCGYVQRVREYQAWSLR